MFLYQKDDAVGTRKGDFFCAPPARKASFLIIRKREIHKRNPCSYIFAFWLHAALFPREVRQLRFR